MNVLIEIAYDGTGFFGWQKTPFGPSIEEELEKALFILTKKKPTLQAASRTDRGVHAKGQIVNFIATKEVDYRKALNGLLPKTIRVISYKIVEDNFHPTLDNIGKEYLYQICNLPVQPPHMRHYSWHIPKPLDIEKMRANAQYLIGEKDFSAFSPQNGIRNIFKIDIQARDGFIYITIDGKSFLYKMVRTIVGTLVANKDISSILASKNRSLAGITAPAHGLRLEKILFPE